jgi:prepilin-type N-terminal cleavage/methylation domain-containing protein
MRRRRRRGFSLLEVLLATAILIGSAVVLMELASIGMRHAASARDLSQAQRLCQSKLNEIIVGVAPAETVRATPLEEDPRWTYWVEVQPTERPGLVLLEVGVAQELASHKQINRFTLQRWIRDPKGADENAAPTNPAAPSGRPGITSPAVAQGRSLP